MVNQLIGGRGFEENFMFSNKKRDSSAANFQPSGDSTMHAVNE